MDSFEIDQVLNAAEVHLAVGDVPNIRGTGFWPAVSAVKRDSELIDRFADRIGEIDRITFRAWARIVIPISMGTTFAVIGVLVGFSMLSASLFMPRWNGAMFLFATGVLLSTTHGLGHLIVGWLGGIRFTGWFVGRGRPQPGVKTNYATYLRASPRARAWMHAAGAIVTKLIPFLVLPVALIADEIPSWTVWTLLAIGVIQVATDVFWSTKSSDWKKYKREMRYV